MTLYLDTSLLVAALTKEAETGRIQEWLDEQETNNLAISDWVTAEFSSALSIKVRSRQVSAIRRAEALAMFARLTAESLTVLPVSGLQFRAAARFADQYVLGLRATHCISPFVPIMVQHYARWIAFLAAPAPLLV